MANFNPEDKQFVDWLARLSVRHELIVRMAVRGRHLSLGRTWDLRIAFLMNELNLNNLEKMAELLEDVRLANTEIKI